jgi:hypothetical protein
MMLQQLKNADAFERELILEISKQNYMIPTMDQVQLNLSPLKKSMMKMKNITPLGSKGGFDLDNIEC